MLLGHNCQKNITDHILSPILILCYHIAGNQITGIGYFKAAYRCACSIIAYFTLEGYHIQAFVR